MPREEKRPVMSDVARQALVKLATPEAVAVMEHMQQLTGDNQNQNNNSGRLEEQVSREELMKSVNKLPTEALQQILKAQGVG